MYTRLVRGQLLALSILTVLAVGVVGIRYMDLPGMFGVGVYPVIVQFSSADGLYPGGDVTYRGVPVGKIEKIGFGPGRTAQVRLTIQDDVRIPAAVTARAVSMSAVGERSVDLVPAGRGGPDLAPGAVVPVGRSVGQIPEAEILSSSDALFNSVPKRELSQLLSELTTGFGQGSRDFGPLLDATRALVGESQVNLRPTRELLAGLRPFLRTQLATSDDLRAWNRDLATVIGQLRASDADVRTLLTEGPRATDEVVDLVKLFRPGLRPMLDDFADAGRMLPTYLLGIQQVLVIYPAIVAAVQSSATEPGTEPGTFHMSLGTNFNEPPPCYAGFMPIDRARDLRIETPPASLPGDLYCKVPHADPRDPRGARNTPCLNAPGVRAASVEECLGRPIGSMRHFGTAPPTRDR
ncbi:hypothetical protein GCM10023321_49390 [Pseudonocardia eucalypti]|uniref:Mce/MlaD domain-containing protein n=1 Tax=Pseudonocardia eucalypti TaxID=648755 RepID=A0ABP9QJM6_9PSEU|nr:phospholipid/cholesterol/gamma-HCH transport system substrate-binding protein [Pseudonocardia eucalypti]